MYVIIAYIEFKGMKEIKKKNRLRHRFTPDREKINKTKKEPTLTTSPFLSGIEATPIPTNIKPMLATLADKPLEEDEDWLYELKWDGFRALAYLNQGTIDLKSRNNKSFNEKFYPVYNALKEWSINAVVDGEIVVVNDKGLPDFAALQTWRSEADGQLIYYVFDLLWLNGKNLMKVPFNKRRELLKQLIPSESLIQYSQNFDLSGKELFTLANQMGLEGIVAKKKSSNYIPDVRSKEWLKIKTIKHQEAIIGGYTRNEGSPKAFSALLMGLFINGEFTFIGPVGTGFTTRVQNEILSKLKPLETNECPFTEVPEFNKPSRFRPNPPKSEVVWVKPELIAEITYRTVASDGSLRHPSFKGLREDKEVKEVQRETPINQEELVDSAWIEQHIASPIMSQERKTLLNPSEETQVRSIEGHSLKFPNLSKVFWPDEKITKRDVLNYYYQIAPIMLPYLKERPQTLHRFPNGIAASSFYQKDVTGKVPEWIDTFHYYSETDHRNKQFVICNDEASLLYIASLGCIEINPWSSRKQSPDSPDWCIIDLDPDSNSFEQVIETAQVTKQVLDALGISSYCKTSGSTGLHIYIPLQAGYSYEDSKEFGRALVKIIQPLLPEFTSIERKTMNRKGKIYLDFLQNRPQATVAAPYSLRPKPGATVSMPLHWEEVKKGLKIKDFNIHNAIERVKAYGDLFQGALGPGIAIESALMRMKEIFK